MSLYNYITIICRDPHMLVSLVIFYRSLQLFVNYMFFSHFEVWTKHALPKSRRLEVRGLLEHHICFGKDANLLAYCYRFPLYVICTTVPLARATCFELWYISSFFLTRKCLMRYPLAHNVLYRLWQINWLVSTVVYELFASIALTQQLWSFRLAA